MKELINKYDEFKRIEILPKPKFERIIYEDPPELILDKNENIYVNERVRRVEIQKAIEREKRRLEGLTELIRRRDKVRRLSLRNRLYIISAEQYCSDYETAYPPFIPKVIANKLKRIVIRQLCKQYRNIWKGSVFIYFLRIGRIYPILSIEFKVYQSMGLFSSWSVRAEYEVNIDSDQIKLVSASPDSF